MQLLSRVGLTDQAEAYYDGHANPVLHEGLEGWI